MNHSLYFMLWNLSSNLYAFFLGKKVEGNEDDIPSSAVDLQVKERVCVCFSMNFTFLNDSENNALCIDE